MQTFVRSIVVVAFFLTGCPPQSEGEGEGEGEAPVFVDGDGFPELTATPTTSGDVHNGETLHVQVPVDADTVQIRLAVEDFATSEILVQNFSAPGAPSSTFAADIEIPVGTTAPTGTYYVTVELCSSEACENPFKRVSYERLANGDTYQRTDFDSPPLVQVGEPRDSGIAIAPFSLTNSNDG